MTQIDRTEAPLDDDRGTYERNSRFERVEVTEKQPGYISVDAGWSVGPPEEVYDAVEVGSTLIVETIQGSQTIGWAIGDKWIVRKTDQEIEQEHEDFVHDRHEDLKQEMELHRDKWQAQQDALPQWIQVRILHFHFAGGDFFLIEGWGYELIVARLAVAYANMGEEILDKGVFDITDSEEVADIAREEGTSGNQHQVALKLAQAHLTGQDLAETPSALVMLTGDANWTGDNLQ